MQINCIIFCTTNSFTNLFLMWRNYSADVHPTPESTSAESISLTADGGLTDCIILWQIQENYF
jgi:hypothetical protein